MSHEAKEAALTIVSRHRRVRSCRIVIRVPVSATQGASRVVPSWSDPLSASSGAELIKF